MIQQTRINYLPRAVASDNAKFSAATLLGIGKYKFWRVQQNATQNVRFLRTADRPPS